MKKFLTLISAILTAAVLFSGCESGTADNHTESETTTASAVEETESQTETTFSETETTTETTTEVTTETSETTVGTGGTTAEGLVISPSGYVLDPQNVLPEGTNFWTEKGSEEVCKSGLAYLLTELPDGETRIYGACPNEEPSEIIIEHDGIGDEFEQIWWTRYGDVLPDESSNSGFTLLDIDGDGENEVVMKVYASSGTFHCVYELFVYKIEDGHYISYDFESGKFADDYIKTDIDSDAKTVTVSVKGSDKDFVYNSSESCPDGVKSVFYKGLIVYDVNEDGVKVSYYGLMGPDETGSALPIDDMIRVDFKVNLKDGEFVLSEPVIMATDDFDSYNDW